MPPFPHHATRILPILLIALSHRNPALTGRLAQYPGKKTFGYELPNHIFAASIGNSFPPATPLLPTPAIPDPTVNFTLTVNSGTLTTPTTAQFVTVDKIMRDRNHRNCVCEDGRVFHPLPIAVHLVRCASILAKQTASIPSPMEEGPLVPQTTKHFPS